MSNYTTFLLKTLQWLLMLLKTQRHCNDPIWAGILYISAFIWNHFCLSFCSCHMGLLLFFTYTNHAPISRYFDLPYNFPKTVFHLIFAFPKTFFHLVFAWLTLLPRLHLWSNVSLHIREELPDHLSWKVFPIHTMQYFLNSVLDFFRAFSTILYSISLSICVHSVFSYCIISSRSARIFIFTIVL